ncbi:MAG TPA: FliM/FliN family flagellar motor C-terminal domain-containing protein [Vicinamibacterales bacterium]|nr:FliM/FliN family flagellar motor C-terminal domain-containing protein [Vicinamibacterales bacterium]
MSSSLTSSSSSSEIASGDPLAGVLDVDCAVEFVIGTGRMTVRDCLRLERSSIVRLEQSAGSDLELRVQGHPLAAGEVVVVDDSTALRISRVIPPAGAEVS